MDLDPPALEWRDAARPELSGPELLAESEDGTFLIHYTTSGEDAVSVEDVEELPSAVTRALDGFLLGRDAYEAAGWRALAPDDGEGGSEAIDVYLQTIDSNGYTYWTDAAEGEDGHSCWMKLDNHLTDLPGQVVESVAIHELHHCIEARYSAEIDPWFVEATATFEQYRLLQDPALQLALGVLWGERIGEPERPLDDATDGFEYSGFVWVAFWEQFDAGASPRGPELWEALADEPDWRATFDAEALRNWDLDLDGAFLEYATWNAFACGRNDGAHYDDSLPCPFPSSVPIVEVDGDHVSIAHTATTHTAAYFVAPALGDERPFSITCEVGSGQGGVRLVALDHLGTGGEAATGALSEAMDPEGSVLIVSTSTGAEPVEAECDLSRVELPIPEEPKRHGCSTAPVAPGSAALYALLACGLRRVRRR